MRSAALAPGSKIDRYLIEEPLGRGGMGSVYRALDTRLRRRVALKVVRAETGTMQNEMAARMMREARAVAALSHPNVVTIFDVGELEGFPYLAMEMLTGSTLRSAMHDERVARDRKLRWLVEIGDALAAAHRAGIVHRDVKPENVMVLENGTTKVLDFGIARAQDWVFAPATDDLPPVSFRTADGIIGTPKYMAPEQLPGVSLDARADQFAWGIVAYEVLALRHPSDERPEFSAAMGWSLPPRPLEEVAQDIPPAVARLVQRALERDRSQRWPTMDSIVDALVEAVPAVDSVRERRASAGLLGESAVRSSSLGLAATVSVSTGVPGRRVEPQPGAQQVRPGEILAGKYRVEHVLGTGGMGMVVAATHLHLQELVALKLVLQDAITPVAIARFQREGQAAAKLKSEHVARVLDIGMLENGAPYMVMEYLEGSDLSRVVRSRGPLPLEEVADYVLQTCEAIAEAHAVGIIHRDLKPQNLFLTFRVDGRPLVKVLDFGISKFATHANSGERMSLTGSHTVLGTPRYMSPEQLRTAKDVDHRTDIWALGVILYELLGGCAPFTGASVTELAAMILQDTPRDLREIRGDVPAEMCAVIARCMEKDPNARYQSVAALANQLECFRSRESLRPAERILAVARSSSGRQLAPDSAGAKRSALPEPPPPGRRVSSTPPPVAWAGTEAPETPPVRPPRRRGWVLPVALELAFGATGLLCVGAAVAWRTAAKPVDAEPVDTEPVDAEPADAQPVDGGAPLTIPPGTHPTLTSAEPVPKARSRGAIPGKAPGMPANARSPKTAGNPTQPPQPTSEPETPTDRN